MSEKMYTCLLRLYRLYPSAFRKEYEDEALQLIRDRIRDERGFFKKGRLYWDLLADVFTGLPRAYENYYAAPEEQSLLPNTEGIPSFKALDKQQLGSSSILIGSTLSVLALTAFGFVLSRQAPYQLPSNTNGPMSPIEAVIQRLNQAVDPDSPVGGNWGHAEFAPVEETNAPSPNTLKMTGDNNSVAREQERTLPIQMQNLNGRSLDSTAARKTFAALSRSTSAAVGTGIQVSAIKPSNPDSPGKLSFEVVSIHEEKFDSDERVPVEIAATPDGYRMNGVYLMSLIQIAYIPSQGAYRFGPNQIVGLPEALDSVRYDIEARVSQADLPKWNDPALQPAMLRAMLQSMLADRFKLAVHHDTRVVPIYEMTAGERSPKFKPSEGASLAEIRQKHPNARTLPSGAIMASGPNPGEQWLFGLTMPALGDFLSTMAGLPIQDKTGLAGKYDIAYELESPSTPRDGVGTARPGEFYSSQIFYVVQDQLGLKLKPATGPVESLVIDHVERATQN